MIDERGTGKTSKQLQQMKHEGCFIWCNSHMSYPRQLCMTYGGKYCITDNRWIRDDYVVYLYPRSVLSWNQIDRLAGHHFREVVLDHAIVLSQDEKVCYLKALSHVRP